MGFTIGAMDVAEVYSPERVVKVAKDMGLDAGFSLDITNVDERGCHGTSLKSNDVTRRYVRYLRKSNCS